MKKCVTGILALSCKTPLIRYDACYMYRLCKGRDGVTTQIPGTDSVPPGAKMKMNTPPWVTIPLQWGGNSWICPLRKMHSVRGRERSRNTGLVWHGSGPAVANTAVSLLVDFLPLASEGSRSNTVYFPPLLLVAKTYNLSREVLSSFFMAANTH